MKTQIFENLGDFRKREDIKINGVSKEFAEKFPNYEIDNKTNQGCWECLNCKNCEWCENCSDSQQCKACSYCKKCKECCL